MSIFLWICRIKGIGKICGAGQNWFSHRATFAAVCLLPVHLGRTHWIHEITDYAVLCPLGVALNWHILDLFSVHFYLYLQQIPTKHNITIRARLYTLRPARLYSTPARYLPSPPAPVLSHLTLSPELHMGLQPVLIRVHDQESDLASGILKVSSCKSDLRSSPCHIWHFL